MILDQHVEIKLTPNNYLYLLSKGYHIPKHIDSRGREKNFKRGATIKISPYDLSKKSNIRVRAKCHNCEKIRSVVYAQYSDVCHECNFKARKGATHYKYNHNNKHVGVDRQYDNHLRKNFGITYDNFLFMLSKQNYKCAICQKPQGEIGKRFCVDHNHKTGKIRQLLCFKCNTGLGNFSDNIEHLLKAARYLEENL